MTSPGTGLSDDEIVRRVRDKAGLEAHQGGPSDSLIVEGVRGFAREFEYWYARVLAEAVPKFSKLIIDRINPMIRGMQLDGVPAPEAAARMVADYAHRNYVTAGGWALEQLAISASPRLQKSSATGIDAEWHESGSPPFVNLYVIKSGTVTRNSDILKALKSHGSEAQKRLLQTDKRAVVRVHYAITAGQKSSTFHDGVFRPSSAEFWAQAFALDDDQEAAVELTLAMAQTAGALLRLGGEASMRALEALEAAVASYIESEGAPGSVDWEYLARRNMIGGDSLKKENARRKTRAVNAVKSTGFKPPAKSSARDAEIAGELAEAAAEMSENEIDALTALLPGAERQRD